MLSFTPGSSACPHPPEQCRWDGNGELQFLTNLLCYSFLLTLLLSFSVGFSAGSSLVRKICSSIGSLQVAVPSGTSICSGVLCGLQGRSALPWITSSFLLPWYSLSCFLLLFFPSFLLPVAVFALFKNNFFGQQIGSAVSFQGPLAELQELVVQHREDPHFIPQRAACVHHHY